jgi:hypothetical protein
VPLKFFFDECVDEDIAAALRAHDVDVKTTSDLGRKGATAKSTSHLPLRKTESYTQPTEISCAWPLAVWKRTALFQESCTTSGASGPDFR